MDVLLKWPYFGISPSTLEPLCGIYRCFDPDVKQWKRTTWTNTARRCLICLIRADKKRLTALFAVSWRVISRRCVVREKGSLPERAFFSFFFQADAAARSLGWRINTYYLWQRRSDEEEYSCCPRTPPWDCYLCSTYIRHRCAHTHLSPLNATWQLPLVLPPQHLHPPTSSADNTAVLIRHEALRRCRLIWIELSITRAGEKKSAQREEEKKGKRNTLLFFKKNVQGPKECAHSLIHRLCYRRSGVSVQELIDNATWRANIFLFFFLYFFWIIYIYIRSTGNWFPPLTARKLSNLHPQSLQPTLLSTSIGCSGR